MTMADEYVRRVMEMMPASTPRREQIGVELRAHIAERVAHGRPVDDVLRQLGDPGELVDSYLSANPLVAASPGERALAKLIDTAVVLAVLALPLLLWYRLSAEPPGWRTAVLVAFVAGSTTLCLYTIAAEYRTAQTLGKRVRGLHVVGETGRRITLGQAVVRQLAILLSLFLVDAAFALFTDRQQRAFELLSKTRVVLANTQEA